MKLYFLVLLLLGVSSVQALFNQIPTIPANRNINLGTNNTNSGDNILNSGPQIINCINPCHIDYYLINVENVLVGDYLYLTINYTTIFPGDYGRLYLKYHDPNFALTPWSFPDDHNYDRKNDVPARSQFMEVTCWLRSGQYVLGVAGGVRDQLCYNMTIYRRFSPVQPLVPGFEFVLWNETRAVQPSSVPAFVFGTTPPQLIPGAAYTHYPTPDTPRHYRFFSVTWDRSNFREGTFMVARIFRVQKDVVLPTWPSLRALYGGLPQSLSSSGAAAESRAPLPDDDTAPCLSWPHKQCTDELGRLVDCECTASAQFLPGQAQPFEFACNVTVSPCRWQYGTWYLSVWYPPRRTGYYPGYLNYTIQADIFAPRVYPMERNITYKGFVDNILMAHYRILVPLSDIIDCDHHFLVHVDNVRGGSIRVYVHQSPAVLDPTMAFPGHNLAGDPTAAGIAAFPQAKEACMQAEYQCDTCCACNLVVPKCKFKANYWYIGVAPRVDSSNLDRLPVTYTIRANWMTDPAPRRLMAGKAVCRSVGENLYDFYVIDLPETVDTWLFVEMFVRCQADEVVMYMKHGEIPGETCYSQPDFYCATGEDIESCSFMINVCEMEPGPLYITVYGVNNGLNGNAAMVNTYCQEPVDYCLWADFDVASQVGSGECVSDCVNNNQYKHYYLRADSVLEGSMMSVELTKHNDADGAKLFVNYNFLAGEAPCYDDLLSVPATPCGATTPTTIDPMWNQFPTCAQTGSCGSAIPAQGNLGPHVLGSSTDNVNVAIIHQCDFRSGVWYFGVKGKPCGAVNANGKDLCPTTSTTKPQCFTLCPTVHDPPKILPAAIGSSICSESLPSLQLHRQFSSTHQYHHFKIAAQTQPGCDLTVAANFKKNFNPNDPKAFLNGWGGASLDIFLNRGNLATDRCYRYSASTGPNQAYAQASVPYCQWKNFQWWVSVRATAPTAVASQLCGSCGSEVRYCLDINANCGMADCEEVQANQPAFGEVACDSCNYYVFHYNPDQDYLLYLDFYAQKCDDGADPLTIMANPDKPIGMGDCYTNMPAMYRVDNTFSTQIQFEPWCDPKTNKPMKASKMYVSVCHPAPGSPLVGGQATNQYKPSSCLRPTKYTFTLGYKPHVMTLAPGNPHQGHIISKSLNPSKCNFNPYSDRNMYKWTTPTELNLQNGAYLSFEISNVRHGSVKVYAMHEHHAGPAPCYQHMLYCRAAGQTGDCPMPSNIAQENNDGRYRFPTFKNWCEIRIPYCLLRKHTGTWYFTVEGRETFSLPGNLINSGTKDICYTIEMNLVYPRIADYTPRLVLSTTATPLSQRIGRQRVSNSAWHHWIINWDPSFNENFLIVEVTSQRYGGLEVLFARDIPGDMGDLWNPNPWWTKTIAGTGTAVDRTTINGCFNGYSVFPYGTCGPLHDFPSGGALSRNGGYCGHNSHTPCMLCKSQFNSPNCWAQVPYCDWQVQTPHYISITGNTGEAFTEYTFGAFRRAPVDLNANFETNITHFRSWTHFFNLRDVTTSAPPTPQFLEVRFYRIRNNLQPNATASTNTDFVVYMRPDAPAGNRRTWDMNNLDTDIVKKVYGENHQIKDYDAHGRCYDHVRTWSRFNQGNAADALNPLRLVNTERNVSVWNCDLRAGNGGAASKRWMMTVDPLPILLLDGTRTQQLSYSVNWKVRSLPNPIDISNFTNNALDARNYTVLNTPINYRLFWRETYMTFVINAQSAGADARSKLVIQTIFESTHTTNNHGRVYIMYGDHAMAGHCNEYSCAYPNSHLRCDTTWRFSQPQCEFRAGQYFITVRQYWSEPINWRFRIHQIEEERPTIDVRSVAQTCLTGDEPNKCTWRFQRANNITGIRGESYHHYMLNVLAADIADHQMLVVNFTDAFTLNNVGAGDLSVYMRKGYETGPYRYVIDNTNDHLSDFCYTYRYKCSIGPAARNGGRRYCVLQVPYCQLEPGNWYFSVYNENINLATAFDTTVWRGYSIWFGFQEVQQLTLDQSFNTTRWTHSPGVYYHYRVSIPAPDFDHFVRFRANEISSAAAFNMYIRRGDLAGPPRNLAGDNDKFCLDMHQMTTCSGVGGCTIDFVPCGGLITQGYEGHSTAAGTINPQPLPHRSRPDQRGIIEYAQNNKWEAGVYYIAIFLPANTTLGSFVQFKLRAFIQPFDMVTLGAHRQLTGPTTTTETGGHRQGTTNHLWEADRTRTTNLNLTSDPTLQWWQLDIPTSLAYKENSYLHISLDEVQTRLINTIPNNTVVRVRLDVFRNDCAAWYSCDTGNELDKSTTLAAVAPGNLDDINPSAGYLNCPANGPENEFWNNDGGANINAFTTNHCSLPAAAHGTRNRPGFCHIDAVGLSPCSLKKSEDKHRAYRFRIWNPSRADYRLRVWLNETTTTPLFNGQNYTSVLYRWQYEHFTYEHNHVINNDCTLRVDLYAICGSVEGFIRRDAHAGPSTARNHQYNANGNLVKAYTDRVADDDCNLAWCSTDITQFVRVGVNDADKCTMFLDTCVFHPNHVYYIGVRGVTQEFPTWSNRRLYLPAKFVITPTANCRTIEQISWTTCGWTMNWQSPCWHQDARRYGITSNSIGTNSTSGDQNAKLGEQCKDPEFTFKQYFIDIETWTVGCWLRFDLTAAQPGEWIHVSHNRTVGYSKGAGDVDTGDCPIPTEWTAKQNIVINGNHWQNQGILTGRWYIRTNAKWGRKVQIDRWCPSIPFVQPNWPYSATIFDVPNVRTIQPFAVPLQHYRLILDGHIRPDDSNYWLKVIVSKIMNGDISVHLNDGLEPRGTYTNDAEISSMSARTTIRNNFWNGGYYGVCDTVNSPIGWDANFNCYRMSAAAPKDVTINVKPCTAWQQYRNQWFITIEGLGRTCQDQPIKYSMEVKPLIEEEELFTWRWQGRTIAANSWEHFRLCDNYKSNNDPIRITPNGPRIPAPQRNHTILSMWVHYDLNNMQTNDITPENPNGRLTVYMNDKRIAAPGCTNENTFKSRECNGGFLSECDAVTPRTDDGDNCDPYWYWSTDYTPACPVPETRWLAYERICQFDDLRVTIHNTHNENLDYIVEPRLYTVDLIVLTDGIMFESNSKHTWLAGSRDFFIYQVNPAVVEKESYLWVELESVGRSQVWVNQGSLAWNGCSMGYCQVMPVDNHIMTPDRPLITNKCYAHDKCNFKVTDYYLTVVAEEYYNLTVQVRTNVTPLPLGARTAELTIPKGTYAWHKITLTPANIANKDSYLQVDIADVHFGGLAAAIRYNKLAAPMYNMPSLINNCYEGVEDPVFVDWDSKTPGYSGSIPNDPMQAWLVGTTLKTHHTIRYSHCQLDAGDYYLMIFAPDDYHFRRTAIRDVRYKLEANVKNYGPVAVVALSAGLSVNSTLFSGLTDFYVITGALNTAYSFAEVKVHNVRDGRVVVRAKRNYLAAPGTVWGGVCEDCDPVVTPRNCDPIKGVMPQSKRCYFCSTNDDVTLTNAGGRYNDQSVDYYSTVHSCAFMIDTCDWDPAFVNTNTWYLAVTSNKNDITSMDTANSVATSYSLQVNEIADWEEIHLDYDGDVKKGVFPDPVRGPGEGTWSHHHYKLTTQDVRAVRIRFHVSSSSVTEGIAINVRDHECDQQAQWQINQWCDADYSQPSARKMPSGKSASVDVVCEVEIPNRESHPFTSLTYYITVKGKSAAYSISYHQGWMETCEVPQDLEFCSGIVDYPVYIENDAFVPGVTRARELTMWKHLDLEAKCNFDKMCAAYQVGTQSECYSTLRRFACYESFKRCDSDGFQVGSCRIACESVEYFCAKPFASIGLPQFDCNNDRYIDHIGDYCTGHHEEVIFPQGAFPKTPGLTLLESAAPRVLSPMILIFVGFLLQLLL